MGISKSKWFSLIQLLAPIILTTVKPQLAPMADQITGAIQEAEQIKGATGAEKLQHVQNIAQAAANSVNTVAGKNVIDTTSLQQTVQEAVDTTVAAVNLIHKQSTPIE